MRVLSRLKLDRVKGNWVFVSIRAKFCGPLDTLHVVNMCMCRMVCYLICFRWLLELSEMDLIRRDYVLVMVTNCGR